MKFLFVSAIIVIVIAFKGQSEATDDWKEYKTLHSKNYNETMDGGKQEQMRKQIFLNKDANIRKHNSGKSNYKMAHNQFSDRTNEELRKLLGTVPPPAISKPRLGSTTVNQDDRIAVRIPSSLDYRYDSCLTPVRNQGSCGSCWAFSAITPLEFSRCKNVNAPVVLSEQQLVDCDTTNYGCNGGWYVTAWTHLQQRSGSFKRTLYPYTARKGTCRLNNSAIEARVNTFNYVAAQNAPAMQFALQKYGPLAVAMTVVNSFYNYAGGVYNDPACDGKAVNHGVNIVGWGVLNGIEAWIVRNTWGHRWGVGGYFFIQRGVNKCGIEEYPAYATAN